MGTTICQNSKQFPTEKITVTAYRASERMHDGVLACTTTCGQSRAGQAGSDPCRRREGERGSGMRHAAFFTGTANKKVTGSATGSQGSTPDRRSPDIFLLLKSAFGPRPRSRLLASPPLLEPRRIFLP